ncbi:MULTISPECIES: DMT family transporter [unclassified Leifsonia]|uniref:DMT family transporter n=1 Tax=unclassified Leifsonia TaxID=2663824 RepID=UPI001F3FA8BB|nr:MULTISPECIES: DMT family transporter [unclassified Leifsonia]
MTQQDAPAATAAPHAAPARPAIIGAVACAVVSGVLVAVQSRINGELGRQLGDGFAAALISFGSGLVILLIALALWRPGRAGFRRLPAALRDGRLRWWMLLGGAAGAFLVLTQGLTAAVLGVALFSVATVAGQSISGLLVDRTTLVSGGPRPLTVPRVVGAVLAILAVIVSVATQLNGDAPFWMLLLPFLAGLGLGWQQAVNGRVRESAESALTATVGNFAVGTVVLLVAFLVHALIVGWPQSLPTELWLYLGGVIGCVFIAAAAVLVRITGALLLSLAMIAGQLVAAVVIDTTLPGHAGSLAVTTVVGTVLALAAVVVAGVNWRQFRRAA